MMKKLLFSLLITISFLAHADTEFKIITLQHSFASDLLPTISPMVGPGGTATGTNNQLILRASPDRMREIEIIVRQLDVARVNRRITVKSSGNFQSQRTGIGANGKIQIGKVAIGNNRYAKPNRGNIDLENNSRNTQSSSSQFLNVLDGQRGFIRVGQIVPYTQEWITITRRYTRIDRTTDWHEISTGFAVRPRTVGNQVELEITPRIAKLNSRGFIDFEELSTTVRVTLGEWVDIGSTMQNHDDVSRKILGFQHNTSQQQSNLVIKVD